MGKNEETGEGIVIERHTSRRGEYQRDSSPNKHGGSQVRLSRPDQKALIYLVGLMLALLNGFLLNKFSQEFRSKFVEHIEIYEYRIKSNEDKIKEQETRVRNLEIRLGGKK